MVWASLQSLDVNVSAPGTVAAPVSLPEGVTVTVPDGMAMLHSHSFKSAARELHIAPETERVHRKRLYSKLGISSHADLFWMFIESFSYFDPESTADPLQEYLRLRLRHERAS